RFPDIVLPGDRLHGPGGYSTLQLIDANYDRFPIYAVEVTPQDMPDEILKRYRPWKVGALFRLFRKDEKPPLDELYEAGLRVFASQKREKRRSDHIWEKIVNNEYGRARRISADEFVMYGLATNPADAHSIQLAVKSYEDILQKNPEPEAVVHKN